MPRKKNPESRGTQFPPIKIGTLFCAAIIIIGHNNIIIIGMLVNEDDILGVPSRRIRRPARGLPRRGPRVPRARRRHQHALAERLVERLRGTTWRWSGSGKRKRRPTRPPRSLLRRLRQLGPNFGIPTCRPLGSVASDRRRPDGNATSSLLPRARFGEGARRDRIANAVGSGRSLLRRRFRRQRQPVGANRSRPRRRRPADIDGESRTRSSAFRPPPLRRRRTVRFSDDAPPPGHDYLADRASLWSDPRVAICTANPGDVVAFHFRTLHAAPGTTSADRHHGGRRTVVSFRYLGDDARWATRPWKTSPPFADEGLVPGDVLDEGPFPIVDL